MAYYITGNYRNINIWLSTALLEEERRSNCQQTEESTKQIQYLQSKHTHRYTHTQTGKIYSVPLSHTFYLHL